MDVALRQRNGRRIIHLVNRASGIPNTPNNGAVDAIPCVGPVRIEARCPRKPRRVSLAWERAPLKRSWARGRLTIEVATVRIHAAVVVE